MRNIEMGIGIWRATGSRLFAATFLSVLAEAHMHLGDLDKAEAVLQEALSELVSTGERHNHAEVLRALGQVHERRGDTDGARKYYDEAADIATAQNGISFALRARRAAFELDPNTISELTDVVGQFEPDLDWPELQEAKALTKPY